jgi:hypothetical protein
MPFENNACIFKPAVPAHCCHCPYEVKQVKHNNIRGKNNFFTISII